jgi:hypothetical protein
MAERAALTTVLGLLVYVVALWWLAPDICRRALALGRRLLEKATRARRERVLQA